MQGMCYARYSQEKNNFGSCGEKSLAKLTNLQTSKTAA